MIVEIEDIYYQIILIQLMIHNSSFRHAVTILINKNNNFRKFKKN